MAANKKLLGDEEQLRHQLQDEKENQEKSI